MRCQNVKLFLHEPSREVSMATTSSKGALLHQDPNYAFPVLERGEGIYLYDEEGKRYIDGVAGAGNVTLGHGRKRIAAAMAEQAESLGYCFSAHFSNRVAIELAERLAVLAPGDLNHAYFVSGGSEGIETALSVLKATGKPVRRPATIRPSSV